MIIFSFLNLATIYGIYRYIVFKVTQLVLFIALNIRYNTYYNTIIYEYYVIINSVQSAILITRSEYIYYRSRPIAGKKKNKHTQSLYWSLIVSHISHNKSRPDNTDS